MLDAYIIDQIKRKEEERRREQPRVEIPPLEEIPGKDSGESGMPIPPVENDPFQIQLSDYTRINKTYLR